MTKKCLGCERPKNDAEWVHFDGKWESYYCSECIDLDAPGEQYRLED